MKTRLFKAFLTLLLCCSFPALASDGDSDVQKEKSISKAYIVNPDAGIDIRNQFGSIYVTTWDENKIEINVVIKVRGKNEDIVNKRLNSIDVDITALKSLVTAVTKLGSFSGKNISMEINYTVKMPKKGAVKLNNQYGNIVLDRLSENCTVDLQYGTMTATALEGRENKLNFQYASNCTIGSVKSAAIVAQYSGLKMDKAGLLAVKGDYSNFTIKDVDAISYNIDYGSIVLNNAGSVAGSADYSEQKIGNLEKMLSLKGDYGTIVVSNIMANAGNITISGDYNSVSLTHDADYAFDFEYKLEYISLKPEAGMNFKIKRQGTTDSYYKGLYKNSGSGNMNINMSFGSLRIQKK